MIVGTIKNVVNQMQLVNRWKQKKSSGNVLNKENSVSVMSQAERIKQHFQEQLERDRESSAYSQIYNKIASGKELSSAEENKLRQKDPKAYMEYKADRMDQKAYERRLKNCKTKEEAKRLHVNKMGENLAKLKNIINNPNIPKSEKLKETQRIMGNTYRAMDTYTTFIQSTDFEELPTEEELAEASKVENTVSNEQSNGEISVLQEEQISEENQKEVVDALDSPKQDVSIEIKGVRSVEMDVIEEMKNIKKKHFGKQDSSVHIDITM